VLAYCVRDPHRLYEVEENLLFTKPAKDIYRALQNLHNANATITAKTLAAELSLSFQRNLTDVALSGLWLRSPSTHDYDHFRKHLLEARAKEVFQEDVVKPLISEGLSNSLDMEKLVLLHQNISEFLQQHSDQQPVVLTAKELALDYERAFLERLKHGFRYSSGCSHLDARLTDGFAPGTQTVLFGATGSGKTNFALSLNVKQMHKDIPSVLFTLEMSREQIAERIFCMKSGIPLRVLHPRGPEETIPDNVHEALETFKRQLAVRDRFKVVDQPGISLADLEYHIRVIKQQMRTDYMSITIDLASMIKEFAIANRGNRADQIEWGMNELNRMAKQYNIHILSVVQSNRDQDKGKILKKDDIEKMRPTLSNIKSSHAYAERARIVLGLHRERYYVERYLPELLGETASGLEVDILKQSQGECSRVRYFFDGANSQILPDVRKVEPSVKTTSEAVSVDPGSLRPPEQYT
jgi:replicative DNA helicase